MTEAKKGTSESQGECLNLLRVHKFAFSTTKEDILTLQ